MNREKILKFLINTMVIIVLLAMAGSFYFFNSDLVSSIQTDTYSCMIELRGSSDVYVSPVTCKVFHTAAAVFFVGVFAVIVTGLALNKKRK